MKSIPRAGKDLQMFHSHSQESFRSLKLNNHSRFAEDLDQVQAGSSIGVSIYELSPYELHLVDSVNFLMVFLIPLAYTILPPFLP